MIRSQYLVLFALFSLLFAGCSVKRFAINRVGDALASGGSTYESDDDVQLVGREAAFDGFRDFIGRYKDGPDFPVIQDLLAVMREHAPDAENFDAFAKQWFLEVAVPEYRIVEADVSPEYQGGTLEARGRVFEQLQANTTIISLTTMAACWNHRSLLRVSAG